ncbi:hypothetical protein [Rhodococcus sp. X156]|uniref:hypothetical protein n=1 Tax=Rhodococcus sp. X156 TaxID=2499145 RepID=UPI000FD9B34B|nr:hypothetical protein [Rhodococcus sp. X156]
MPVPKERLLDVAGGDPVLSRQLTDSLRTLSQRSDDRDFSRLVEDVLAGRRTLREAHTDPAYARVMNVHVRAFAQRWEALTDEEKAELAAEGERQAAAARSGPGEQDEDDGPDGPLLRSPFDR